MMKKQNGITLIALVITIIVLLILAGVSIAMLTGDNGILTKATESTTKTKEGEVEEAIKLVVAEIIADNEGFPKEGINSANLTVSKLEKMNNNYTFQVVAVKDTVDTTKEKYLTVTATRDNSEIVRYVDVNTGAVSNQAPTQ